jgi:hypothetical protein
MDVQENNSPLPPDTQASSAPLLDSKGLARRRFTRAGAGATGVILTLYSHNGMAGTGTALCNSPSGFVSVTTGASAKPQFSCATNRSHGYWKNHANAWETSANIKTTAIFGSIFMCGGNYSGLSKATLMQVIDPTKDIKRIDRNNVAMQCVAALLNARASQFAGTPGVLGERQVIDMWNEFATTGSYRPGGSGTTPWSGAQIASYLESTFR